MQKFVETDLIFMTLAGSIMYGTNTQESDIDKRGICVPPKNVVMGFARNFEQQEFPNEDTVVYSLMKFMKLAVEGNPNILEILFAPEECVQVIHLTWKELQKYKQKFLTADLFPKFRGYAESQFKKMKILRENRITNPPTHKPIRSEFDLLETGMGVRELVKGIDATELDSSVMEIIDREKKYKAALLKWNQYQEWLETRNPERFQLELKCGYDGKNASHLVRSLRMLKEVLLTGVLNVKRQDAKELLEIRNAFWTYEELIEETDKLKTETSNIYDNKKYVLPNSINKNELSDLAVELHEFHWNQQKGK